jgi:hypothetical protein
VTPKHLWSLSAVLWLSGLFIIIASGWFSSYISLEEGLPPTPRTATHSTQSFPRIPPLQEALATPAFSLSGFERPVRLPDLRAILLFYNSTERPDRPPMSRCVQFGIRGVPAVHSAQVGTRVFLRFDLRSNRWNVSESETPLTCVFSPTDTGVRACVTLLDEKNAEIAAPDEFHTFTLASAPPPPSTLATSWAIDEFTVDASLFERQGAAWWGQDEVVKDFGGEEMAHEACRQRVQFGSGDDAYLIWVAEGDCFMCDKGRWLPIRPGDDSINKPLVQAKTIDDKAIHFQIWNPEGTSRCNIDLGHRQAAGELVVPEIKMIGARSKRQWVAEICTKRITLTPDDWVVLTARGPVHLNTTQLLDDYLQGRLVGNLLVFSGIEKIDGDLCLAGSYYDATRTRKEPFYVSLYRSWEKRGKEVKDGKEKARDEAEEDEEAEDSSCEDGEFEDDDFEDDDED